MNDPVAHLRAADDLPPGTAHAAAQTLDLSLSHRLVYVGGTGEILAAFLDSWRQLTGTWVGPDDAQGGAEQFLVHSGLAERARYEPSESLVAVPAGDLVVVNALDAAVEQSLQLLVSVDASWLPEADRLLILQRRSPHLSSVVDQPLLQAQGLRVASRWALSDDIHLLVCAPAPRFAEYLDRRVDRVSA